MEYDCHTMLYIIYKKYENKESYEIDEYFLEEIMNSEFDYEYEEIDEYENGKNKDFRINNKNKILTLYFKIYKKLLLLELNNKNMANKTIIINL